jgi:hypothetical protein
MGIEAVITLGAIQAIGSLAAGSQQAAALREAAAQERRNLPDIIELGRLEKSRVEREGRIREGQIAGVSGAAGVTLEGSPLNAILQQAQQTRIDAELVEKRTQFELSQREQRISQLESGARGAEIGAVAGAASSILGSIALGTKLGS